VVVLVLVMVVLCCVVLFCCIFENVSSFMSTVKGSLKRT
jgi:hypothetical protein